MSVPSPNITLTGTFIDSQGNTVNGGTVTATLQNYGGQVAMIAGSAILETTVVSVTMTSTNTFSMSLYANDQISPPGTWWNVAYPGPGGSTTTKNYSLTGVGSFDLSNLTPLNQPPTPQATPGQTLVQPFAAVAHKFVTGITSAGALITAQPASADISDGSGSGVVVRVTSPTIATPTLTGVIPSYNGVSTVANGFPQLVAKADMLAQAANIGNTTLYAVPANGGGMYRISAYAVVTQAASVSSTLPQIQVVFTDNDSNVTTGAQQLTNTNTGNTLGFFGAAAAPLPFGGVMNCKASTNIVYSTTGYASSGATPMQFAIHVKLEYLGN